MVKPKQDQSTRLSMTKLAFSVCKNHAAKHGLLTGLLTKGTCKYCASESVTFPRPQTYTAWRF